jgi:hypothetical protein
MCDPGLDEWDLYKLSLVLQLMNGFDGVNGIAAVTLIEELPTERLNKGYYFICFGF